jgi:hypothetical protein
VNVNIRERILRKLFPEVYRQVDKAAEIVANYQELKDSLKIVDGTVIIEGPAGILGSLANCKVEIRPQINTELVLSKYELESMLKMLGDHQMVSSNYFTNQESKEKIEGTPIEGISVKE